MKKLIVSLAALVLILSLPSEVLANSAPVVSNVTASQRGDDSKLVDIHYDLADANGDNCTVWFVVSDNNGISWRVPVRTFSGDVGPNITPGLNKSIVWDAGADMPGKVGNFKARVYADDGNGPGAMVPVPGGWFPYQNVSQPEDWIFVDSFLIDKYEVTNQFYCQFLNDADPNAEHWTTEMKIDRYGDYGNYYYTVQSGKEQYPIWYVNFYDAEAFAAWRSSQQGLTYQLPTPQEWEKAAGWDPVEEHYYIYGFHRDSIDCSWCNYNNCVGNPTPVGYYDGTGSRNDAKSYYGCYDMSGNVFEWTSGGGIRGGGWTHVEAWCRVSVPLCCYGVATRSGFIGFRLVLDLD